MAQAEEKEKIRKKMKKLLMTLIEGHAFVVFKTRNGGEIEDVLYEGVDTRMFETMWIGMNIDELPRITPMICGVCSATHHVASVKAADQARGAEAPGRPGGYATSSTWASTSTTRRCTPWCSVYPTSCPSTSRRGACSP